MDDANKAADDIPEELVITFRKPVVAGDQTYNEMTLREPMVGEIDKFSVAVAKVGAVSAMSQFIATISGLPKGAVDKIGARDFTKAQEYLNRFLDQGNSQKTTETS